MTATLKDFTKRYVDRGSKILSLHAMERARCSAMLYGISQGRAAKVYNSDGVPMTKSKSFSPSMPEHVEEDDEVCGIFDSAFELLSDVEFESEVRVQHIELHPKFSHHDLSAEKKLESSTSFGIKGI